MSDGDLISELNAGCFRRLVVQLYAVTGDLNEAQEAVQEAFTKALAAPRRFAELEKPEAWLRRVAVNVTRSRYRRRRVLDGLLRRIGPPPAVADHSPEPNRLARLLVSRDDGRHFTVAREYGPVVGPLSVAPGYAWLFGPDDGSAGEPDRLLVTTDTTTWAHFTLAP